MKNAQILPAVLIVLDIGSAMVCGWSGDVRRAIYWGAAAILTASVTF